MKNFSITVILLALTFSVISCHQHLESGMYITEHEEIFYAVEIDNATHKIKIYCCGTISEKIAVVKTGKKSYRMPPSDVEEIFNFSLPEKEDDGRDFKKFREGNFSVKGNEILISDLESDIFPGDRPEKINVTFSKNKIRINCADLYQYMFASPIYCRSKQIEFIKE